VYKLQDLENFMKTFNFKKLVKGVLLSAALVTSVVACGNKNKDNPNPNAYQMSCANCTEISGITFYSVQTAVQSYTPYGAQNVMRISWNFSGQNIQQPQNQSNGNYTNYYAPASMMYTGKVSAIGTAAVSYPMNTGMCAQIPTGSYNILTRNVGNWAGNGSQAQVSGLQVELSTSGYSIIATLSNVWAVDYGYGVNSTRMSGTLQITQINGVWCNASPMYMY